MADETYIPPGMCETIVRDRNGKLVARFVKPPLSPMQTIMFARAIRKILRRGSKSVAERRLRMAEGLLRRKKRLVEAQRRSAGLAR